MAQYLIFTIQKITHEMTQDEAKKHGATHIRLNPSGKFIELYYMQKLVKFNDGTEKLLWNYLSSFNVWMPSIINTLGGDENLYKIE